MDYNEKCRKCGEEIEYVHVSTFGRVAMKVGTLTPHVESCSPAPKKCSTFAYKGARKDRQAKKHKVLEPARFARRRAEGAAV